MLWFLPGNQNCCDCSAENPEMVASMNYGITVCKGFPSFPNCYNVSLVLASLLTFQINCRMLTVEVQSICRFAVSWNLSPVKVRAELILSGIVHPMAIVSYD